MSDLEYLSIPQLTKQYPFSLGQIRHYLMLRHKNGLNRAVRKIGKRLYIRKDVFEGWIESKSNYKET